MRVIIKRPTELIVRAGVILEMDDMRAKQLIAKGAAEELPERAAPAAAAKPRKKTTRKEA